MRQEQAVGIPFSAVLLTGGKSTRMGCNKALIEIKGVPLWQRQLQILEELAPTEIFLAGPSHSEWKNAAWIIVPDAQENSGPLGGLVAALRHCCTSLLLALAVDLPQITSAYLHGLLELCEGEKGVVPMGDRNRFEPLIAVYPRAALTLAEELLASGRYSMQNFANLCLAHGLTNGHSIAPADAPLFFNMNTPEDFAAACKPGLQVRRGCDVAASNRLTTSTPAAPGDAACIG